MRPKSVNPYGICFIILRFLSLFIIHIEQIYGKTDESDTFNATNLSVYLLFRAKTTIWRKKLFCGKTTIRVKTAISRENYNSNPVCTGSCGRIEFSLRSSAEYSTTQYSVMLLEVFREWKWLFSNTVTSICFICALACVRPFMLNTDSSWEAGYHFACISFGLAARK